jgi:hypothetical protein
MGRYQICVALDERFGPNDVSVDLLTDQQHPLHKHEVQIATNPHGRAVLVLISQASICGPPSSPAWPWFGKAVTYQSQSRRAQPLDDPVWNGWHERRPSATDRPEHLID